MLEPPPTNQHGASSRSAVPDGKTAKASGFSLKRFQGRFKVGQKIALGYGIALSIAVVGTTLGIAIGNGYQHYAKALRDDTLEEFKVFSDLQTQLLYARVHQQQLAAELEHPEHLQEEYSGFRRHIAIARQRWEQIDAAYEEEEVEETSEELAALAELRENYTGLIAAYEQEMAGLWQQIERSRSSPEQLEQVRSRLGEFDHLPIVEDLPPFLTQLEQLVEIVLEEEADAEAALAAAERLRVRIVSVSVALSIAIATLLAILTTRAIARPIQKVTAIARRASEEENFDLQTTVATDDEIGSLAASLNQLIRRVKQLLSDQQENNAFLNTIIDNLADGLLVTDADGRIARLNPALASMLVLPSTDLSGKPCDVFDVAIADLVQRSQTNPTAVFTHEIDLVKDRIGQASVTGITPTVSIPLAAAPDSIPATAAAAPPSLGAIILIRDITSEKEVDRMKTDFIATVSHELRTPLTSVMGFADAIQDRLKKKIIPVIPAEDSKTHKALSRMTKNLDIILAESERLTALINDVLDISKLEAGKVEWKMQPVAIHDIVQRAFAATASLFKNRPVSPIQQVDPGLPEVICDRDRLIQVLINLISNAVKFTEAGSVTCHARIRNSEVLISIIDTGIGIDKQHQAQVFDRFKQVGEVLKDKPRGTGLGLPICKQIVEHHGGKIWVESEPRVGSTFSFTLPLHTSVDTLISGKHFNLESLLGQLRKRTTSATPASEHHQPTILVVDDDANIRELLKQSLEAEGYTVREAEDGVAAIQQVKIARPDLIILDVMMPHINGFEVAAVLKNDPQTMEIPIILLSIVEDRERGYRLGVDRYLTKPINKGELLTDIETLLSQGISDKKVLVVDRNASTLAILAEALQAQGYAVMAASNGEECIEKAIAQKPDLIIVDSVLSEQQDLVKTLRFEKGLEEVVFILLAERENEALGNLTSEEE